MRRKDFLPFVERHSEALVKHAQAMAASAGACYDFPRGPHSKEQIVQQQIRERRLSEGPVAVLCCLETCRTVKLLYGDGRPRLVFARRPQRVLYYYFLDPEFGLIYVRLQTWFPFTIQVYVNGHEWLARKLLHRRLGFEQRDNAFTQLDHPDQAQRLAEHFPHLPWVRILQRWARRCNPLLGQAWLGGRRYRWVKEADPEAAG